LIPWPLPGAHLRRGGPDPLMAVWPGRRERDRLSAFHAETMAALDPDDVTALLRRWQEGRSEDNDRLSAAAYAELPGTAAAYLRRERADHTLQPSAVVNEAYLRLAVAGQVTWENRGHFFGIAARVMRQTLVDHARKRRAGKRGKRVERSVSKIAGQAS